MQHGQQQKDTESNKRGQNVEMYDISHEVRMCPRQQHHPGRTGML